MAWCLYLTPGLLQPSFLRRLIESPWVPEMILCFCTGSYAAVATGHRLLFTRLLFAWIFKVRNGLCYILAKMVRLPRNEKLTYWLNSWPQMWSMGLTLDMTLAFSSWPWPWISTVKYGICYFSARNGPIATKQRANTSILSPGLRCDHRFWPWLWPWPWIFMVKYGLWNEKQTYRLNSRSQIWPVGLNLAMTLILNFLVQIRNLPVKIYRTVAGVTSDIGVPSTRLVGI